MILHTAIIKWKAGTPKSEIDAVITEVKDLAGIDGVTDFACGPVLQNKNQAYDFMLTMRVPGKEFLEKTYLPHSIHMRVGGSLIKLIESVVSVDAEV